MTASVRPAARSLLTTCLWAVLGLGLGLASALVVPAVVGWRSLTVMSGSMEPAIDTGDVVVTRPIAALTARVGDVVTFRDPTRGGRLVTHRVRRIQVTGATVEFETKGDANNTAERWAVPAAARIGLVDYRLPHAGYPLRWVDAGPIHAILLLVPSIGLGAWALLKAWRPTQGSGKAPVPLASGSWVHRLRVRRRARTLRQS